MLIGSPGDAWGPTNETEPIHAGKEGISIKTKSYGACSYVTTSPKPEAFVESGKAVNIRISFEEALKLNLAIDEAVRQLNSYNRATQAGKRQGLNLCLYFDKPRITVTETTLPKPTAAK